MKTWRQVSLSLWMECCELGGRRDQGLDHRKLEGTFKFYSSFDKEPLGVVSKRKRHGLFFTLNFIWRMDFKRT